MRWLLLALCCGCAPAIPRSHQWSHCRAEGRYLWSGRVTIYDCRTPAGWRQQAQYAFSQSMR